MNSDVRKYDSNETRRPTTAPSYTATTVIKHIGPRTIGVNGLNSIQGSLRNFSVLNAGNNFRAAPRTTNHGLVTLAPASGPSGSSDRIPFEDRELAKLNETLADTVLQCCSLETHNRALELQIEWLKTRANRNSSTIEKMFRTEVQTAQELIQEATRFKADLNKKLRDIHQTTLANDEHYQQLLAKRNATNRDLFNYQRQLSQNRAEIEFLNYRLQYFNDEIQFYTVKNNVLHARQVKLRYEVDEEIYSKQSLQMQLEVLKSERISNEDVRSSAIDVIKESIDVNQLEVIHPSSYFREQLNHEIRRMRADYEKKIEVHRSELHRKLDLELHRYQIVTLQPMPTATREHEQQLASYIREKKTIDQQIGAVLGQQHEIENQFKLVETRIHEERRDVNTSVKSQRHLAMLEQVINERERQLNDALRERTRLKEKVKQYQEEVDNYPKHITEYSYKVDQTAPPVKSILRTAASLVDVRTENNQREKISSSTRQSTSVLSRSQPIETEPREKPVTRQKDNSVKYAAFNVEKDCGELNKIFGQPNVDVVGIIRILCNRNVDQRYRIRNTYRERFGQDLYNVFETDIQDNSTKILKVLLLSSVERDCYELQRVLKSKDTDENVLIEIFLGQSNHHIRTVRDAYSKLFQNTLEEDIIGDQETPSKRIFLTLLQANRPETNDQSRSDELLNDARALYETNALWQIDGAAFVRLIPKRSNEHLKQIFDNYKQFSRVDIEQVIKNGTDVDLSRTLMAIVRIVRNQARFFAYQLRKSLKGSGTNEDNLNRIFISRSEIDMNQIKSEYKTVAKRTLHDHIQSDTNGNYRRALLELLLESIESTNRDVPSESFLQFPTKTRLTVQWRDSISTQAYGRSVSSRDVNEVKRFDRNNQAKQNTLREMSTKLSGTTTLEQPSNRQYASAHDDDDDY